MNRVKFLAVAALLAAVACSPALAGDECKNTPIGKMTRSQVADCDAMGRFLGGVEEAVAKASAKAAAREAVVGGPETEAEECYSMLPAFRKGCDDAGREEARPGSARPC